MPIVRDNLDRETHVMTDEARPLCQAWQASSPRHGAVDHARGEYGYTDRKTGDEDQHQHRRGLLQHLQARHDRRLSALQRDSILHRYLAEFDFRYSQPRSNSAYDDGARADRALLGVKGKRLTYETTAATLESPIGGIGSKEATHDA